MLFFQNLDVSYPLHSPMKVSKLIISGKLTKDCSSDFYLSGSI